jgi:hypothetical protein
MTNHPRPRTSRPPKQSPAVATDTEERDRPCEWLRALTEGRRSYAWLVEDSNGLATAAYRLARARCRTRPAGIPIPTANELHTAARQIETAVEGRGKLPALGLLLDECELRGLPVIRPLRAA